MSKYAAGTDVPVKKSREEIEQLLERYGAQNFLFGKESGNPMIAFELQGRRIRLKLSLPSPDDEQFFVTPAGRYMRTKAEAKKAYEREVMRLWRGLVLILKAKLEAVQSGIATLDEEFLSNIILPNDQSVAEWVAPQIAEAYRTNKMPMLFPGSQQKQIGNPDIIEGEVM